MTPSPLNWANVNKPDLDTFELYEDNGNTEHGPLPARGSAVTCPGVTGRTLSEQDPRDPREDR